MGSFFDFLGNAGSLIFQWAGLSKQEEQAKKAFRYGERIRKEDIERSDKRYQTELGFRRREMRETKKEREKEWKWREEERDYMQGQNMVNRFTNLLASGPAGGDRLMMTWNSAKLR